MAVSRRACASTVPYLSIDELVHACNVLPFLLDEVSVLNLPHFAGNHGEFVVSLIEDAQLVKRLTRLTFEPSPAATQYGRSREYLYESWPFPSNLYRCSWDSLVTLHLHVTWALKAIDAAIDSPMAVLESLEITLPVLDAVILNYAHCFPILRSLKLYRAYPDRVDSHLYTWSDLSKLPATLTLLDAGWARVTDLPSGLLSARIGELDQWSEILQFPSSLTTLMITHACGEMWSRGYSRLASDHVRVTLEDISWDRRMSFPSVQEMFPANIEKLVGTFMVSDDYDIIAPSNAAFSAQPNALFMSVEPKAVQIEELGQSFISLDSPVVHAGRRHVHIHPPPIGSAPDSVATWVKQLHGLIVVNFVGQWHSDVLAHALLNLPVTVSCVLGTLYPSLGTGTVFKYLPPTVTIVSMLIFNQHLCEVVENLPQTVRHLVLPPYSRDVVVGDGPNLRTAPLTVWVGCVPSYMYDGHGGIQKIDTPINTAFAFV